MADAFAGSRAASLATKYRWWICALLFFATTINYVDRQVISVLKPTLSKDLHWSETDYGTITAWFSIAYAAGYLFAGRLMDVIGVRIGYALSVGFWSVAAVCTGFARSVFGFTIARGGLGLSEGGNFPAAVRTVSEWFPKKERALATGLFNAGSNVGPIVAPAIVPWITLSLGWQAAFMLTGAVGFVWLALWLVMYRHPDTHPRVSAEELAYIQSDPLDHAERISWMGLLKQKATWACIVGIGFSAPIWWFYLFWLPDFLYKTYHLDLKNIGPPLIVVYVVADLGSIGAGWLSSTMIKKGWDPIRARKTALLSCALCVLPIFFAGRVNGLWATTAIVSLAAAAHQGWSANMFTFVSDTVPRRAVSTVVGMGGCLGGIIGFFNAKAVGYLLDQTQNNYTLLFGLVPTVYLLALLILHLLVKGRQASGLISEGGPSAS